MKTATIAVLGHLLAAAQLAEMSYQADPKSEHKREAWEKALNEYDEAAKAEREANPLTAPDEPKSEIEILSAIVDELDLTYQTKQTELEKVNNAFQAATEMIDTLTESCQKLDKANGELIKQKEAFATENTLLKNQLIEKDEKIAELQKSLLSANSPTPATRPLTGAAKAAAEKKAAEQAASQETDETKKNS